MHSTFLLNGSSWFWRGLQIETWKKIHTNFIQFPFNSPKCMEKKGLSLLHQRNQHDLCDLLMIDATLVFIKSTYTNIHPGRLTWNLQITHLKGKWSSKPPWLCSMLIFRGVPQTLNAFSVAKTIFNFRDLHVRMRPKLSTFSTTSNRFVLVKW